MESIAHPNELLASGEEDPTQNSWEVTKAMRGRNPGDS